MIKRVYERTKRLRPHVVDPGLLAMVSLAFGVGVLTVAHHGKTLRLDVEGASLAWVVLVAFGVTYHGEWRHSWRVGAGLMFGAIASVATYYGAMSRLPLTPFSLGLGLGVAAVCVAAITHLYPRAMSFAGAAVGFGVGIAAARALPIRPTTPADDMWALMLTMSLTIVMGVGGSMVLRALVIRMGMEGRPNFLARYIPHRHHHEDLHHEDLEDTVERPLDVHGYVGAKR